MTSIVQRGITGGSRSGNICLVRGSSTGCPAGTVAAGIQVLRMHVLRQVIQTHALPHGVHDESDAEQHNLAGAGAPDGDRRVVLRLARAGHLRVANHRRR